MKVTKIFLLLLLFGCATVMPIRFPKYPDGVLGNKLRGVLDGRKKVAVVAKELPPAVKRGMDRYGNATEMLETIRSAMKTNLEEFGYYVLVDIDSRNNRYNELARTQTGLTTTQLGLGKELAVDHLFFVNMTAVPRVECKIELMNDPAAMAAAALQLAMMASGQDTKVESKDMKKPTGVLYLTVFAEGTLVNVETGKSISYSVQEPYRLESQVGNTNCPSELKAFNEAVKSATKKIALQLSPVVVTVHIPLLEKDKEVKIGNKETINQYLEDGVKWIEAGDVDQAFQSWKMALDNSGGTSASALWNLAIVSWYKGEMDESEKYFNLAIQNGGRGFIDKKKREIFAIFKQEKKRMEEERD